MATISALNTVIDLANKESDEAAKRLAAALRVGEETNQKFELLMQYRNDYAERCQSSLTVGISTTHFNNFQVFMQKRDYAIAGQRKVVGDATQRIAEARAAWQACEQKKMSFVTLAERASKEDARRELCGTRSRTTNTPHGTRCTSEPLAVTGRNPMNTTPMNINPVNAAQAQPGGPRQQDAASQDTPFSQVLSSEIAQSRHSRNVHGDDLEVGVVLREQAREGGLEVLLLVAGCDHDGQARITRGLRRSEILEAHEAQRGAKADEGDPEPQQARQPAPEREWDHASRG